MFCHACGNRQTDVAKFCGFCGTPLLTSARPEVERRDAVASRTRPTVEKLRASDAELPDVIPLTQVETREDGTSVMRTARPLTYSLMAWVKGLGRPDTIDIAEDADSSQYEFTVASLDESFEYQCYFNVVEDEGVAMLSVYYHENAVDEENLEQVKELIYQKNNECMLGRFQLVEDRTLRYFAGINVSGIDSEDPDYEGLGKFIHNCTRTFSGAPSRTSIGTLTTSSKSSSERQTSRTMTNTTMTVSEMSEFFRVLVELRWMAGTELPILHCPITRQRIAAGYDPASGEYPAGYEVPDWSQIPTVLFHYAPEVGEFDYIVPALQEAIDEKRKELLAAAPEDDVESVEEMSDFEILQDHVDYLGEVPLVFGITTRSVACGPINASVYVGLDLAVVANSAQ